VFSLFFDVFLDRGVGDGTSRGAEVADGPKMLPPELFLKLWKLHLQLSAALPLEVLDYPGDGDVRRDLEHEMNVIGSDGALEDIDFFGTAYLTDDISQPKAYVVLENLLAVFSAPNNVVFIIVDGMGSSFVSGHTPSILKSWAKAQSFTLGVDNKNCRPSGGNFYF
jgi:hypothetical protein